ncbi:Talin-2, partial [Ophiophagus hannah]
MTALQRKERLIGLGSLPQASHTHDAILEAAQLMKEAVDDIMVTLNEAASEVGMVGNMVDSIAEAMSKTTVVKYCRAIAVTAQEMVREAPAPPDLALRLRFALEAEQSVWQMPRNWGLCKGQSRKQFGTSQNRTCDRIPP